DGALDFSESAQAIHDRVRGLSPWPGAHAWLEAGSGVRERIKIHRTRVASANPGSAAAGQLLGPHDDGVNVACGEGVITIRELQFEGGKRLPAATALAGRRLPPEARFGKPNG